MTFGKSDTVAKTGGAAKSWPPWARVAVTLAILFHATAIWAAIWGRGVASSLEIEAYDAFKWYYGLIDQGYTYRYYSDPAHTPIVKAVVHFKDGHTEEVRLPDRGTKPRLLYQRELALANWMRDDAERARQEGGNASLSRWAQSYARHLGKINPGATSVTLSIEMHLIPNAEQIRRQLAETGKTPDLDDRDQFYSVPERIGDYPCDAS
jgi:hypothetical protein